VISRFLRPLDRYVFAEWVRIFVVTALGFPLLVVIIDLTDNLDKYLSRQIPYGDLALSYLYWLPDSMFMILPAAVLFATVFTIGSLTRYSEITAAKASGISFYRMIAPIAVGAVVATGLGLLIGEVVPKTNSRRQELLRESEFAKNGGGNERFNFAYAAERGGSTRPAPSCSTRTRSPRSRWSAAGGAPATRATSSRRRPAKYTDRAAGRSATATSTSSPTRARTAWSPSTRSSTGA
jgi:hypothetical protein